MKIIKGHEASDKIEAIIDEINDHYEQSLLELYEGGGDSLGGGVCNEMAVGNVPWVSEINANSFEFIDKIQKGLLNVTSIQDRKSGVRSRIKGKDYSLAKGMAAVRKCHFEGVFANPEVEVIAEINEKMDVHDLFLLNPNDYVEGKKVYEVIEKWVRRIKKETSSRKFKKIQSNRNTTRKRRFKAMLKMVNEAFSVRENLIFCRCDFFYQSEERKEINLEEFERDYRKFFNNIRHNSTLCKGLLGVINKLEYGGYGKGFHFHGYFVYDRRIVRWDDRKSFALGKYWKSEITDGRGSYFSSNASIRKRRLAKVLRVAESELGLGPVKRGDVRAFRNIKAVIWYLSKFNQAIRPGYRERFNAVRIIRTPYLKRLLSARRKRRV